MQEQNRPRRRRRKRSAAAVVVLIELILLVAAVLLVIWSIAGNDSAASADTVQQEGVVTIAAVGDIHMEPALMDDARTEANNYDFSPSFLGVADLTVNADITVGNLECSFAGPESMDKEGWAPDGLSGTLSGLGFDVLQTANSYAITGGIGGLERTMQIVESAQMQTVGTARSKKEFKDTHGIAEREVNGMRVVFVAFTKGLNNMSLPEDTEYAVNLLYEDYDTNYAQVATEEIQTVMAAARKRNPDVLIALVHWGVEGDAARSDTQEEIADLLVREGADAIIGSHSHLVGEFETRTVTTEDGEERSAFIAYDLGDFYSASEKTEQRQSILLQLEFTRDKRGNTELSKVGYVPLYRVDAPDSTVARYQIWDARLAMELYEEGYVQRVSREDYDAIAQAVTQVADTVDPEPEEE